VFLPISTHFTTTPAIPPPSPALQKRRIGTLSAVKRRPFRTDARLRTSDEHVHAIGDVANIDHPVLGHPLRVEHWDTAKKHGATLAATLSGTPTDAADLPYFFTDQYDLGMEYVGNPGPEGYDRVVLTGDVAGRVFRAWWLRGDHVVAGMHANDWDAIDEIRRVVGTDQLPT